MRKELNEVIFGHNDGPGKTFDIWLFAIIILSILAVMLESVASIAAKYGDVLRIMEWVFTIFFTIEYALRIYCAYDRKRYIFSFYGIVDLLAILPTYLSLFIVGSQYLMIIRALRLLRIFRIFKMVPFLHEGNILGAALRASIPKITVFLLTVLLVVCVVGSLMYVIEGPEHGFTSIPTAIYWAIVTLTTVGYGDIAPETILGRVLAALVMIIGYAIIAVPTGIVSVELSKQERK